MDEQGFDAFWLAEHHFQPEGYECIPNVLLLALHLTHHTQRLNIGCGFNIAPMWHPLRLAEDYATVDALTGGRVIFGVGRGYHTREIETFGSPLLDQAANRDLFEEQVEIILKSFKEESFSHRGKNYTLPPEVPYRGYDLKEITLVPRPLRQPVECWQPIQSASQRALDFMARHGIKGIIGGGVAEGGAMHKVVEAYRDAVVRTGRDAELGTDLSFGFHFHLAPTREQAIREAAPWFEENLKMFGPLRLVRALSDQQIADMGGPRQGAHRQPPKPPASRRCRRLLLRPARSHHRTAPGRRSPLPRRRTGQRQPPRRHSPAGHRGAVGVVRARRDAGVQGPGVGDGAGGLG